MANEKTLQEIFDTGGFLGQGWSFPPTFTKGTNTVNLVKAEEDIKQSLNILLSTTLGERVMRADFGSDLFKEVFEPMDATFESTVSDIVTNAIQLYEARISLESVDVDVNAEEGKVTLMINYVIRSTNTRSNIVYPYYLTEGTNVSQ